MSAVRALRLVSALEGVSYFLLLFVAMPLKYGFDWPVAVKAAGAGHGWLFVAFVVALAVATVKRGWSPLRAAGLFALSLVPFGFIAIERRLRAEDDAIAGDAAQTAPPSSS